MRLVDSHCHLNAEQFAGDVCVEASGEAEIAHVDPLVGVVDQRRCLLQRLMALREEAVGHALGERLAKPA